MKARADRRAAAKKLAKPTAASWNKVKAVHREAGKEERRNRAIVKPVRNVAL